jgi:hypothetical protein
MWKMAFVDGLDPPGRFDRVAASCMEELDQVGLCPLFVGVVSCVGEYLIHYFRWVVGWYWDLPYASGWISMAD